MACTACATKENPKWKFLKAHSTHPNTNKNFLFKLRCYSYFCTPYVLTHNAEVAQLVEHNLAKVGVAGSNLVFRSQNSIYDGIFSLSSFVPSCISHASVVELVDTQDLKSCSPKKRVRVRFPPEALKKYPLRVSYGAICFFPNASSAATAKTTTAIAPMALSHNHPMLVNAYMEITTISPRMAA